MWLKYGTLDKEVNIRLKPLMVIAMTSMSSYDDTIWLHAVTYNLVILYSYLQIVSILNDTDSDRNVLISRMGHCKQKKCIHDEWWSVEITFVNKI